jgi:hypothetical protein
MAMPIRGVLEQERERRQYGIPVHYSANLPD